MFSRLAGSLSEKQKSWFSQNPWSCQQRAWPLMFWPNAPSSGPRLCCQWDRWAQVYGSWRWRSKLSGDSLLLIMSDAGSDRCSYHEQPWQLWKPLAPKLDLPGWWCVLIPNECSRLPCAWTLSQSSTTALPTNNRAWRLCLRHSNPSSQTLQLSKIKWLVPVVAAVLMSLAKAAAKLTPKLPGPILRAAQASLGSHLL